MHNISVHEEQTIYTDSTDNSQQKEPPWQTIKRKNSQAAPAIAPVINNATLHKTMNRRSHEVLNQFAREYSDGMKYIRSKTDATSTCPACIETQAKRALFKISETNRYAPLEAVSSDTTGPLSQADICGNKYLQLIVDAGTGWTTGEAM